MAFEKFTKSGRGFKPKVSIWSRGQIGFNQGAIAHFELQKFGYVVYFYDAEEKKVGFKFTNDANEDGAAKLKMRGTGASASSKAFLDYYNIDYRVTRKYDISYDKDSELYIIDLSKGELEEDVEEEK